MKLLLLKNNLTLFIRLVLLTDNHPSFSFANVLDLSKKVEYLLYSMFFANPSSSLLSFSIHGSPSQSLLLTNELNFSSLVVNAPPSPISPNCHSLFNPTHPSIFSLFLLKNVLAAVNDVFHGSIGADLANCSANPVRFFMTSSIGHPPSVSESFTNRRMMNIVSRSIRSVLNMFFPSSTTPGHKISF